MTILLVLDSSFWPDTTARAWTLSSCGEEHEGRWGCFHQDVIDETLFPFRALTFSSEQRVSIVISSLAYVLEVPPWSDIAASRVIPESVWLPWRYVPGGEEMVIIWKIFYFCEWTSQSSIRVFCVLLSAKRLRLLTNILHRTCFRSSNVKLDVASGWKGQIICISFQKSVNTEL